MKAAVYYDRGPARRLALRGRPRPCRRSRRAAGAAWRPSASRGETPSARAGGELASVPHVVGYQCAGTVTEVGPRRRGIRRRRPGGDGGPRRVSRRVAGGGDAVLLAHSRRVWPPPRPRACPCPSARRTTACSNSAGCRPGRACWSTPGGAGWASPRSNWPSAPGHACSPPPRATTSCHASRSSASTWASTTSTATSSPRCARLTDGRGADVIVDSVGGDNLQGSLRCLAYRGRCVTVGDAGRGAADRLDVSTLRANNQSLIGYFLGAEIFLSPRAHAMIAGHLAAIAAGELRVVIDRTFPLSQAAAGPRLHREPAGLRSGAARPLTSRQRVEALALARP